MIRSFKYRLYPNKEQQAKLTWTLERCCELYNACLQERRDAWRYARKMIGRYDQQNDLPDLKRNIRPEYQDIDSGVLQNVCHRVDLAFRGFFRRFKDGEKEPGYPRYRSRFRYDSFMYTQVGKHHGHQYGPKFEGNKIYFPKIGMVKVKMHLPIEGKTKTCIIKREGDQWYAVFVCEVEKPEPLPVSYEDVGIDLGVSKLATLSIGEAIEHPRYLRKSAKKLARLQQSLARKKRGSNRRKKAVQAVARAHRKIARQRKEFLHAESRKLINRYQVIVFEDLQIANMTKRPNAKQDEETGEYLPNKASAKAGLNKSILDAGWAMFVSMCTYKAESAGRTLLQVNPRYTSQMCSGCGAIKKKELSERWHSCSCGTELDRDHNAAINILRLGISLQE